jgi:hypothetical protein
MTAKFAPTHAEYEKSILAERCEILGLATRRSRLSRLSLSHNGSLNARRLACCSPRSAGTFVYDRKLVWLARLIY